MPWPCVKMGQAVITVGLRRQAQPGWRGASRPGAAGSPAALQQDTTATAMDHGLGTCWTPQIRTGH